MYSNSLGLAVSQADQHSVRTWQGCGVSDPFMGAATFPFAVSSLASALLAAAIPLVNEGGFAVPLIHSRVVMRMATQQFSFLMVLEQMAQHHELHGYARREDLYQDSLSTAIECGSIPLVAYLLHAHACAGRADQRGRYPLHLAAESGNVHIVNQLILAGLGGAGLGVRDHACRTSLMLAAAGGHIEVVKQLIQNAGASAVGLNWRDSMGRTALHHAVMNGHKEVSRFLLEQGAQLSIMDQYGRTAYQYISRPRQLANVRQAG